jgi:chromate transport protein ChrA
MKTGESYTPGPFAVLFAWIGMIAGGAAGVQANGFLGMLIGAIVLAIIGSVVGRMADAVMAWLIFVAASIVALLINAAIRRFIFSMLFGDSGE